MSFQLPSERKAFAARSRWPGTAFLVEAMLLLVFIMASLAVFTQMFAASTERASESRALTDAVALASTTAEHFAADPMGVPVEQTSGSLRVVCDVNPEVRAGGTMYYAQISVYDLGSAAGASGAEAGSTAETASSSSADVKAVPVDADASDASSSAARETSSAAAASAESAPAPQATGAEDGQPLYSISTMRYVSGV